MKKRIFLISFVFLTIIASVYLAVACKKTDDICKHSFEYEAINDETHLGICNNCKETITDTHSFTDDTCNVCNYKRQNTTPEIPTPQPTYKIVSFNVNGGDSEINNMQFEVGQMMSGLPTPIRSGYAFVKWENSNGEQYSSENIMPDVNLTLTAIWIDITGMESFDYIIYPDSSITITGVKDKSLTNIIIPSTVTSIYNNAFANMKMLTDITLPNSISFIGSHAFYGCDSLNSIELSDNISQIEDYAFLGCSNLSIYCKSNDKPDGWARSWNPDNRTVVWNINEYGIDNNIKWAINNINEMIITGSIDYSLQISLPEKINGHEVTKIADYAFQNHSELTNVIIPECVTSIGKFAFYRCYNIRSITIPFIGESKNNNDNACFGYLFGASTYKENSKYVPSSLRQVNLSDGIQAIPDYSFYDCSGLTNVTIPDSITSIGSYAFQNCYGFTEIVIPNSINTIGFCAYKNCSNITDISLPFTGKSINDSRRYHFGYIFGANSYDSNSEYVPATLKNVNITSNLSSIPNYAFYSCERITEINLPESITSIGEKAFYNCSGISNISIPNTVNSIEEKSFYGCNALTEIIIPDSVTYIGARAFSGCNAITSMTLPNSVTSVGFAVFQNCNNINTLTLPYIGESKYSNTNNHIGYLFGAYQYSDNNKYVPVNLVNLTISNVASYIPAYAFYDCKTLKSVSISESITSIGAYAFYGCNALTNITLNNSLTSIGERAFYNCSSLSRIVIPDSVTSVGKYAFYNCSNITVYCKAASQPSGWDDKWNISDNSVVWGYNE